jgi:signal peptide peptidase SppA
VTPLDAIRTRQPWLIAPDALDHFAARATAFSLGQLRQEPPPSHPLLTIEDGVGIVSIHGPLIRRPDALESWLFGAVDTEGVISALTEATLRPEVEAILLDIDSPGGTVNGTPELAEAVADASRQKFVHAFSGGLLCSAAYWVASQCDAVYAAPSARIGSIGVLIPFLDSAEAFERAGLRMEVFASGKFKGIGLPGTSLTEEQRALLQGEVEEIFSDFKSAVLVRGRKIPDEAMEGQTFSARQAQRHNLAGIAKNRDAVLGRLRRLHGSGGKVDTVARSIPHALMKTVEDQLAEALGRLQSLQAEVEGHQAQTKQLSEELGQARAALAAHEAATAGLKDQLEAEREEGREQLAAARTEINHLTQQVSGLAEANAQLAALDRDLEKRAALRAAQIAAETGSATPARVTPGHEPKPDQPPASAADVWNRQFQSTR